MPLRPGQPAASRQAVLERLSFLQRRLRAEPRLPEHQHARSSTASPIETGPDQHQHRRRRARTTRFIARIDHRLGDSDNLTLRYYYNKRKDDNAISNCNFGPTFCGSQDLKDTNLALSQTHIFGPSVVNEFRFSWVQRDLLFPENDPTSPTAAISGLFTVGGPSNFPQGRVTRLLPVLEHR